MGPGPGPVRSQSLRAADRAPLALTSRQLQIVDLVSQGCTNREVAAALGISAATVKRHLERIYDRAGTRTRAGVAAKVVLARERSRATE